MKFPREFRQHFGASLVKFAAGLTDPGNFKFATWVDAFEKVFANRVRQQKRPRMPRTHKAFFVSGMKDGGVIKYGRPVDAAFGKSVCIGMKTHCRNFRVFKPDWEERVGRFEMKDGGRSSGAGTQHILKRRVKWNRVIHAEKLNAATAEGVGIAWYQFPVMLLTAKA